MEKMWTIAITGASGNMGQAVVQQVMQLANVRLKLLFLDEKREHKLEKQWRKQYGERVQIIYGNLRDAEVCRKLVEEAQYVLSMAAVIPPLADKRPDLARDANVVGVQNMVKAVEACNPQPKFIHISTVAIYGNRDYHHPWGRVGDPLLPSAYDAYGLGKLIGERAVLDSNIATWAVLRQTGMLYEKLLMANIADGLMFHTCFNVPIEWATDHDSGVLIKNILEKDILGNNAEFWHKVYNIGGGKAYRTTGYETFDMGFGMIGGSTDKFMRPNWHATRNFHCMWFADSDELERQFHFQSKSLPMFWQDVLNKNKYFNLAKILPPSLICGLVIKPLLKDANAPYRWVKEGNEGRTRAFFGGKAKWEAIGEDWSTFKVWNKGQVAGHDYQKEIDIAYSEQCRLSHGYDESKADSELALADLQQAAAFRGGECPAENYVTGDLYTKVEWKCAEGHTFAASPYTVLKAGHWCPHCIRENTWNFDKLAKKNPFYQQVWYDTHEKDEDALYYYDEQGVAQVKEDK